MVTAIVIPIICFYFYYLTYKESKAFKEKWTNLDQVKEEAILSGKIISIKEEKQLYYHRRYVHIIEIRLQTSFNIITAKKITPIKGSFETNKMNTGEIVSIYGNWEKEEFRISRIIRGLE